MVNTRNKYWWSNLDMSYGSSEWFKYCKLDGLFYGISMGQ